MIKPIQEIPWKSCHNYNLRDAINNIRQYGLVTALVYDWRQTNSKNDLTETVREFIDIFALPVTLTRKILQEVSEYTAKPNTRTK